MSTKVIPGAGNTGDKAKISLVDNYKASFGDWQGPSADDLREFVTPGMSYDELKERTLEFAPPQSFEKQSRYAPVEVVLMAVFFDVLEHAGRLQRDPLELIAKEFFDLRSLHMTQWKELASDMCTGKPIVTDQRRLHTLTLVEIVLRMLPMCRRYFVLRANPADDVILVYNDSTGLWEVENGQIRSMLSTLLLDTVSDSLYKELRAEIFNRLAPTRRTPPRDENLVPMNNGVFDYRTKQLREYEPEDGFESKSAVNYNPEAVAQVTFDDGVVFDVEAWMHDLFSEEEGLAEAVWKMFGAPLRPNVPWGQAVLFVAEDGLNAKGTLIQVMRDIVGDEAHVAMNLADLTKRFSTSRLVNAQLVAGDENPVNHFHHYLDVFKAVVTSDVLTIEEKHKNAQSFQPRCVIVQSFNDDLTVKDISESMWRRLLFVPFTKTFRGENNNPKIKNVYLRDPRVLEYIAYRTLTLMDDYYRFDEPEACVALKARVKFHNDPVLEFWDEMADRFVWNLVPSTFIYDLYKMWLARTHPRVQPAGRNAFVKHLKDVARGSDTWEWSDRARTGDKMSSPEPLIQEYDLEKWMDITKAYTDEKRYVPKWKALNSGFLRIGALGSGGDIDGNPPPVQVPTAPPASPIPPAQVPTTPPAPGQDTGSTPAFY